MRIRIPRIVRRTIVSVIVLIVLAVAAGIVYVLVTDSNVKPAPARSKPAATRQESALPKPVAPAPNAQEGVSIESLTSPVSAGSNVSLIATTDAGSKCTITVTYNGVQSTDSGLIAKTADAYGGVSWSWTVGTSVPVGNWPVSVNCVYHGRSGVMAGSLQVTK